MVSQESAVVARLGLVVGCGLIMGACALPKFGGEEDSRAFATSDRDADEVVSRTEFERWGQEQGLLDDLMDGEGEIATNVGVARTLYTLWNEEGAGLTEEEFTNGLAAWFPDAQDVVFADWDLDQSGDIDALEIEAGIPHTNLLDAWDADESGDINGDEVLGGYFDVFDTDANDEVTEQEWTAGLDRWNWDV